MSVKTDILLDEDMDLMIKDGDFVVGYCLKQQIMLLLKAAPGDFKQTPTAGVGLDDYLLDSATDELNRVIRLQFKSDRLTIKKMDFNQGKITVDAEHED